MLDAALILAALLCGYLGFAMVALSQERHWGAVVASSTATGQPPAWGLAAGIGWLLVSLGVSLAAQGPSFGTLWWAMAISTGAMTVAFTLSWQPSLLRPLARLMQPRRPGLS